MNTTTNTATKFDRMVLDFQRARFAFNNSRLGSTKGNNAAAKMERLVVQAEKMGFVNEFCTTVNA